MESAWIGESRNNDRSNVYEIKILVNKKKK